MTKKARIETLEKTIPELVQAMYFSLNSMTNLHKINQTHAKMIQLLESRIETLEKDNKKADRNES